MSKAVTAVVAAIVMLPLVAVAGSTRDLAALGEWLDRAKDATGHRSGTAIAVVKEGEIVYEGYFGFADIERGVPVARDTVFYIASATKPFLALNVRLKEDQGRLDTRASLQAMFPDVRFTGIDAASVTARDLLTHSSGIDNEPLVWATAFTGIHDAHSRRALVAASYPDAKSASGTFRYTNVGYNILSVWLDEKLGMPWQDQLHEAIFQPLGMEHTSACIGKAEAADWTLAKPYSFASAAPEQPLYLRKSDAAMHAAGGMVSTAPDLARFLMTQLAQGRSAGRQVFPVGVITGSHVPRTATDGRYLDFERSGYAWGWYTGEYKGQPMLHHFGGFAGFHAHLSFIPGKNIGLVVLNNDDALAPRLTALIADYAYGVLLEEPGIATRIPARFDELIAQAGQMRSAVVQQRGVIDARALRLSRPLEAYVGTYSNDLLGEMVVGLNSERQLTLRWGALAAVASGYDGHDQVRVEFSPNSGEVLAFDASEAGVAGITFAHAVFTKTR